MHKVQQRAAERATVGPESAGPPSSQTTPEITEHSRDLIRLIREAQEAERRRVSRELHDSVIQILSSVQFRLQLMEEKLSGNDPGNWREALKAKALTEKAIQEVRRISRNLRPSELDDLGLAPAIRTLCREFSERTGIATKVALDPLPGPLGSEVELNLYRIIQEALANIEKHAQASRAVLELVRKPMSLEAALRDNGRGFDSASPFAKNRKQSGMGMVDMQERAAFLGGACSWKSSPGHGTEVVVRIPLPPAEDNGRPKE